MRKLGIRGATAALYVLILPGSALASGGLSCQAEDERVTFAVDAGVTHGLGNPVFSLRGTVEIQGAEIPTDLAHTEFDREHLAQYWLDERELRLLLYRERQAPGLFGEVELTIRAQVSDETTFGGQYALAIYDAGADGSSEGRTTELSGAVSCFVE